MLNLIKTGGQKLQNFVDDIWKRIIAWFKKNKKSFDKKLKKIKEYFLKPKRFRFRTTKMLSKYKGEEYGIKIFNFSKVKYLSELERAVYELAIVDGKLYTKNGKLFDTALAGTLNKITQKAIFVMDKKGRIFASNSYPRGIFHHSSFLAGAEVAAAGEIKVTKGVIELVTKQSGHYQPSRKYLKQFMKALEKNGIEVSKINVEF